MGVIKAGQGWLEQIEGIMNGDMDLFMKGVKHEAIGMAGTVIRLFGGPDIDTPDN